MLEDELTDVEQEFIDTLPGPPALANVRPTNIWIIEWLSPEERHTGRELHEWMEQQRAGWSVYFQCETKADVLAAIKRAEDCAMTSPMIPVLHLEAHGNTCGLAPSVSDAEWITWDELTEPLQRLNLATRCNLVVVVAACIGFAAVQALHRGPLAPAVALVGPDAKVYESKLLAGAQEFYRRFRDTRMLTEIAKSASHEMGEVRFELESFAPLCFEAMVANLVERARPSERQKLIETLRKRALAATPFAGEQIESQLKELPLLPPWGEVQRWWDQMFMIDIWPENKERFGIDLKDIIERIERFADKPK
jgi:hypothetical protein